MIAQRQSPPAPPPRQNNTPLALAKKPRKIAIKPLPRRAPPHEN